jgi:hypothetical protein
MTLSDSDGKAACELTSDMMPAQKVTDISTAGDDFVLKYQVDFQGQAFSAKVTLTPVDDKLGINFDVNDGQVMMSGVRRSSVVRRSTSSVDVRLAARPRTRQ